jgi:hypothetical protein
MTRKVSFDVVAEVQVKVRVKIPMTFRCAEGDQHRISFAHAIELALKNKQHPSADFEDALSVEEILSMDDQDKADDYTDAAGWLEEAVQEKVTAGQAKYIDATVVDSR